MTGDDDLAYASAVALIERYRARTLSPVEATKAVLGRIAARDGALNAFRLVAHDEALAVADERKPRCFETTSGDKR